MKKKRTRVGERLTALQELSAQNRRDIEQEVWGGFWADERAEADFAGQELLQKFIKDHCQFGLENLLAALAAGHTVGNLVTALRAWPAGREMSSREIDDLVHLALRRRGQVFLLQYLPRELAECLELFISLFFEAKKNLACEAQNPSKSRPGPFTTAEDLADQLRAAYPRIDALKQTDEDLAQNIQSARPTLRVLAEMLAARVLMRQLIKRIDRASLNEAGRDPDDAEM